MSVRLVALMIFVVTVLTRMPFATAHLYAWDSTLYARALEQGFHVTADPATESPHPPGYIWYVAVAALVRLAVRDSNAALVIDRKSTRLNSSHIQKSRMPSSA